MDAVIIIVEDFVRVTGDLLSNGGSNIVNQVLISKSDKLNKHRLLLAEGKKAVSFSKVLAI